MANLNIEPSAVKKILIIKLRGIGDVILSSIVFDALKFNFPNAQIDFLTAKPSNQVLEPLEQIDNTIIFQKAGLLKRLGLFLNIRKQGYDLVFDFYANPGTAQITYFSGAKYRAGFPYRSRKFAYNIFGPEERDIHHAAVLHLEFLKKIGLKIPDKNSLHFGFYEEELKKAKDFRKETFEDNKMLIGISPSGGWDSKKCPPEKFAEIADAVSTKHNADIMILWGPGDEEDANSIISNMKRPSTLAPPTSIREMGTFLKVCDYVIANDSGPMHIASAVGVPVLGIFGPTAPQLQGPYGKNNLYINNSELHCIVCNLLECKYNKECFYKLDIESILTKFEELISLNSIYNEEN